MILYLYLTNIIKRGKWCIQNFLLIYEEERTIMIFFALEKNYYKNFCKFENAFD